MLDIDYIFPYNEIEISMLLLPLSYNKAYCVTRVHETPYPLKILSKANAIRLSYLQSQQRQ